MQYWTIRIRFQKSDFLRLLKKFSSTIFIIGSSVVNRFNKLYSLENISRYSFYLYKIRIQRGRTIQYIAKKLGFVIPVIRLIESVYSKTTYYKNCRDL